MATNYELLKDYWKKHYSPDDYCLEEEKLLITARNFYKKCNKEFSIDDIIEKIAEGRINLITELDTKWKEEIPF